MPQPQCQLGETSWAVLPLQCRTPLSFKKSVQGEETAKTRLSGTVLPEHHLQGCTRQAASERQDLSCTYLAHHELESVVTIVIVLMLIVILLL